MVDNALYNSAPSEERKELEALLPRHQTVIAQNSHLIVNERQLLLYVTQFVCKKGTVTEGVSSGRD